ncbi:MAG: hypothetical protein KF914_07960 [Rhizobiaceae bacterium]|nr:hypothetical protein [Rhizobiaceae bacterium]
MSTEPTAKAEAAAPGPSVVPAPAARKATLPETTEGMPWPSSHEIKRESNPFTERDWRMLAYAWSGLAVRFAVIFAGAFSVYQFLATTEEKRVERTFQLLETWEKPEYQEAQLAVRERIADLLKRYPSQFGANPSQTELAVYMDRIGLAAMREDGGAMALPDFKKRFDSLVYFLNRVATCVQANQCSRQVTDDYFRDLSVTFWNYFSKYVRQVRASGSSTFAVPVEEYVTGRRPDVSTSLGSSRS